MTSIKEYLTVTILPGSILLAILIGFAIDYSISTALKKEFDKTLLQKSGALMSLAKRTNGVLEFDFADELMPEYERENNPEYFQLLLVDGRIFEKSHSLEKTNLPQIIPKGEDITLNDFTLPNGRQVRILSIAFSPRIEDSLEEKMPERMDKKRRLYNEREAERLILSIAKGTEELDDLLSFIHATMLSGAVVFFLAVLFVIRYSIDRGLTPLTELATKINSLDISSLDQTVTVSREILEIKPIVNQLNVMLDRLAHSFYRERQFSSDVSHELRTPLAELRSIAEVGRMYLEDKKVLVEYFDDLEAISKQMGEIVTSLLALSRCEENNEHAQFEIIKLEPLIKKLIAQASYQNNILAQDIVVQVDVKLAVISDFVKFRVILSNLINNAITYHDKTAKIEIIVSTDGNNAIVTINNKVNNLCEDDISHMFDRFWQKDSARTNTYHSGLGLSLVKTFCQILSIEIDTQLSKEKILSIRLLNITTV